MIFEKKLMKRKIVLTLLIVFSFVLGFAQKPSLKEALPNYKIRKAPKQKVSNHSLENFEVIIYDSLNQRIDTNNISPNSYMISFNSTLNQIDSVYIEFFEAGQFKATRAFDLGVSPQVSKLLAKGNQQKYLLDLPSLKLGKQITSFIYIKSNNTWYEKSEYYFE